MLISKTGISLKERRIIENILDTNVDLYGDYYITRSNIRIYLRDNPDILFDCLNKSDEMVYDEQNENGMAFISGWSDKSPRKYVKILTKDEKLASSFLKIISWNARIDLYAKLKKNNPLIKVFQKSGYIFLGDRGSEILLCRKYIPRPERIQYKKEED